MRYPEEVSDFKVKIIYIGRSTKRFDFNKEYAATYVYGVERGWKASSLDYLLLPDGYRILPWEQKKYFRYSDNPYNIVLKIMYGRPSSFATMRSLVYSDNPFLKMIKKEDTYQGAYFPVPIIYESSGPFDVSRINDYSIVTDNADDDV